MEDTIKSTVPIGTAVDPGGNGLAGPSATPKPPETPAGTGIGANPPILVLEPQVTGSQKRVPGPVSRVCESCGQHPVTGLKEAKCNGCLALTKRRRRASMLPPTKALPERPKRKCARCGNLFQPEGRAQRCDDCRLTADAKTSQCPYCLAVYMSHDDSRAGIAERMHHARKACL